MIILIKIGQITNQELKSTNIKTKNDFEKYISNTYYEDFISYGYINRTGYILQDGTIVDYTSGGFDHNNIIPCTLWGNSNNLITYFISEHNNHFIRANPKLNEKQKYILYNFFIKTIGIPFNIIMECFNNSCGNPFQSFDITISNSKQFRDLLNKVSY